MVCYGNKIRGNKKFFVAATKNFAGATKRFVDRTKYLLSQNIFVIPILTNNFVGITKPFFFRVCSVVAHARTDIPQSLGF